MKLKFTVWSYEELHQINRFLEVNKIKFTYSNVDFNKGEFTYKVNIDEDRLEILDKELKSRDIYYYVEE